MKILVYGGGNIGSLYAAKLKEAGNDVTILARTTRLEEIRQHGILLQEFHSGVKTTTHLNAVEHLGPKDNYELVLVILPRQSISEVLPIIAANQNTPSVMFMGNNVSGTKKIVDFISPERVLLGFPGASGVRHGETIHYLILNRREQPTTIGELDGSKSLRVKLIASTLQSAGFPSSVCSNMDAWLKTHGAEISPTANALYMAGGDIRKLRRNREALELMIRAIREGHGVLSKLGVPIMPSSHKVFRLIPEFLLIAIARHKLNDDASSIKIGHAVAARDEMKKITDEFYKLARQSGIDTAAIDRLRTSAASIEVPLSKPLAQLNDSDETAPGC